MRDLVQCVIRDSAAFPQSRNYFVLEGARTCTVSDQMMKKEVIVRRVLHPLPAAIPRRERSEGLGWGHMPDYLVADELADGRLISLANAYFRGSIVRLVAARKVGGPRGPTAAKLWDALRAQSLRPKTR